MTKYLSRQEVADVFGVSTKTVQRWTAEGLLRPSRIGYRTVRYDEAEVEGLFEKSRAEEPEAAVP